MSSDRSRDFVTFASHHYLFIFFSGLCVFNG